MSHNEFRYRHVGLLSYERLLGNEERELLHAVRKLTTTDVTPLLLEHWSRATFPFEILPGMRELGIAGLPYRGYGCSGRRYLLDGMIAMELARTDCSIATFNGVHGGLAMGSIYLCGSDAAATISARDGSLRHDRFVRADRTGDESGASGGSADTARGVGDTWILNGQKKWIGNAPFGDLTSFGPRMSRRPGERLCGGELFAGVHRQEANAQDRAANRAERPDHAGQRHG